jgi:hypothetical protein
VNKEEQRYWARFWKNQPTLEQREKEEVDMAMTPEGKVKDRIKKYLKEKKIYYIMPATGGYGSSGAPDIVVCHKGKFYGLEVKSGVNKPTELQLDNLNRIEDNGGYAFVVNETNTDAIMETYFND